MLTRRHWLHLLASASPLLVAGCGFALKGAVALPFHNIYIDPADQGPVAAMLRRHLQDNPDVLILSSAEQLAEAEVRLRILRDGTQFRNIGANTYGLNRERQLSTYFEFEVLGSGGKPLSEAVELSQHRDINYDESLALSKEAEEVMLYQDMAEDLARQVMRRLAALQLAP